METLKIKPRESYTMRDIIDNRMIPWATSFWSMRKLVAWDKKNKNILKTVITGEGNNIRYYFIGKNIIKLIQMVETGKVRL